MYKVLSSSVTEITAAATYPVTTTEAKNYLRVDITDDDTLIENLIKAATEYTERYTAQSYVQRTYRADLAWFADEVWLPHGPVRSISSVKYYDNASPETLQTWASTNYTLHNDILYRNDGVSYPTIGSQPDNVQITYVAGWDDDSPQVLPEAVRQAILMLVGDMYENREAQVLCLVAGANSVFYGDTLLTTPNAGIGEDAELFAAIGQQQRLDTSVPAP